MSGAPACGGERVRKETAGEVTQAIQATLLKLGSERQWSPCVSGEHCKRLMSSQLCHSRGFPLGNFLLLKTLGIHCLGSQCLNQEALGSRRWKPLSKAPTQEGQKFKEAVGSLSQMQSFLSVSHQHLDQAWDLAVSALL